MNKTFIENDSLQNRDIVKECNDGIAKADLALEKQKKIRQRIRLTAEGLRQMNEREADLIKIRSDFVTLKEKYRLANNKQVKGLGVEFRDLNKRLNKLIKE